MHTFAVSDVSPAELVLPPMSLEASIEAKARRPMEACASNLSPLVEERPMPALDHDKTSQQMLLASRRKANAFVTAAHVAFAEHLPLCLSPDDIWLCIAQGFGTHVNENAEHLRGRFVRHEGRAKLEVRRDAFVKGAPDNDWQGVFAEFSDKIAEHIGKKRELVVADFSTTGPVERAASEVVLLSAVQSYFELTVVSMCGIPTLTLLGTVEDWISIRRRAEVLAEFDLKWWVDALLPVLDQFVAAARGRADRAFWQSFYKRNNASGGPYVTGWINVLFPYIEQSDWSNKRRRTARNDAVTSWEKGLSSPFGGGPKTDDFPVGLSAAPFVWNYLETKYPMDFLGGFVGISQDPARGAVRPAIGWGIAAAAESASGTVA